MSYFIYDTKENGFIAPDETIVESENAAQEYHARFEAIEWLEYSGRLDDEEGKWRYNIVESIPCRGCETHEGSDMQYDGYGIPTGYWCNTCYDSDKYPYRKDRYDYQANGERLEDEY
jgi:hypothetical protein